MVAAQPVLTRRRGWIAREPRLLRALTRGTGQPASLVIFRPQPHGGAVVTAAALTLQLTRSDVLTARIFSCCIDLTEVGAREKRLWSLSFGTIGS